MGIILPPSSVYKIANLHLWHNLHPLSLFHLYGSITGQFTNVHQIMWCLYIESHSSPSDTTAIHVWVEVCCAIHFVPNLSPSSNYRLAIIVLSQLFTCSGHIHSVVSSVVSPGSFCLLVCSFLLSSGICYEASVWLLYPVSSVVLHFVQNWVIFNFFALSVFVL